MTITAAWLHSSKLSYFQASLSLSEAQVAERWRSISAMAESVISARHSGTEMQAAVRILRAGVELPEEVKAQWTDRVTQCSVSPSGRQEREVSELEQGGKCD